MSGVFDMFDIENGMSKTFFDIFFKAKSLYLNFKPIYEQYKQTISCLNICGKNEKLIE